MLRDKAIARVNKRIKTDFETVSELVDDAKSIICNYCNIKDVPEALLATWVKIAIYLYEKSDGKYDISSISEGDISISFKGVEESVVEDYKDDLKQFRRMRW